MTLVPPSAPSVESEVRQHLGRVAHDLNTPLSAIRLQLFLHRKHLVDPTPQDLHALEVMERNVERIRILVAALAPSQGSGLIQPRP